MSSQRTSAICGELWRGLGDNEDRALNPMVRALMGELREELSELDARIAGYDRKIRELYRNSEICQRLGKVEGIGPVTATALVAAVGDRSSFKNGRQFAAWLGLVPKQRSSGGRARLFGISKRGDRYLRTLLIHGARAVLGRVRDKQDPRSLWLGKMRQRRHPTLSPSRSPTRMRASPGACSPATASMTPVFRSGSLKESPNERINRSHLAIASIGRRWRNGHSVASRTWCLDRHGFGQCLGAVEVEARENPSWLAATTTIAQAASGSRIYVSSCDPWTRACQTRCNRAGSIYVQTCPLFAQGLNRSRGRGGERPGEHAMG